MPPRTPDNPSPPLRRAACGYFAALERGCIPAGTIDSPMYLATTETTQSIAYKSAIPIGIMTRTGIHLVFQGISKINGTWSAARKATVTQNQTRPFSFHRIAIAIITIEIEKTVGRARANLPNRSNKAKRRKAPTGIKTYPHNGKRIRLSSAVITLSSRTVFSIYANQPLTLRSSDPQSSSPGSRRLPH